MNKSISCLDDFLVAGTDLEMRLLTWEPCDTLASCQLPSDRHVRRYKKLSCCKSVFEVLNVSLGEDFIDVISYTTEGALILNAYPIEVRGIPFRKEVWKSERITKESSN